MFSSTSTLGPRLPLACLLTGTTLLGLSVLSAIGCGSFAAQGMNAEGVRLFQQSQYQESIRQFQQAIFNDPNNADAYYNLAAAYHRLGTVENRPADLAQAEHYYNQCLDHAPDHRECYRGLAVLLSQQGHMAEAFHLLEGWVDRSPGASDPKVELARLCEETGDRAAAKQHLTEALKVDERNPRALAALGRIREQMGESQDALLAYQRSLVYDRFQPDVRNRLAALQATLAPQVSAPYQPTMAPSLSPQPTLAGQPTLAPPADASTPSLAARPGAAAQSTAANPSPAAALPPSAWSPPTQTAAAPAATSPAAASSTPSASPSAPQNASTNTTTVR